MEHDMDTAEGRHKVRFKAKILNGLKEDPSLEIGMGSPAGFTIVTTKEFEDFVDEHGTSGVSFALYDSNGQLA